MALGTAWNGILGGERPGLLARGVQFDGSTDYLARGTDFTGAADSKLWTVNFLIYVSSNLTGIVLGGKNEGYQVAFNSNNLTIIGKSSATTRLQVSVASALTLSQWNHVVMSVDMSDTGKRHLYINDADASPTWSTYSNNVIDFTQSNHFVGAWDVSGSFSDYITAGLGEIYHAPGQYIDISSTPNRRKFITSDLKPVNLGSDGSNPTGTAPILYNSVRQGDVVGDFKTNRGSGGGMTEGGSLVFSSTDPSD